MRSRDDLQGAEPKIELFLSDLAVKSHVAASTQNQAINALLFLYPEIVPALRKHLASVGLAIRASGAGPVLRSAFGGDPPAPLDWQVLSGAKARPRQQSDAPAASHRVCD